MVKRVARYIPPVVPSNIKLTAWGAGATMHRVHGTIYVVDQFNPSLKGNARFSPIRDPSGSVIPTLYAATTPRGALMESVFRDVPYRTGLKNVDPKRLEGKASSVLLFQADFQLLDLSKVGLRGHGIQPRQLIDTTKARYPDAAMGRAGLRRPSPPSGVSLVIAAG
jgi:RES domain